MLSHLSGVSLQPVKSFNLFFKLDFTMTGQVSQEASGHSSLTELSKPPVPDVDPEKNAIERSPSPSPTEDGQNGNELNRELSRIDTSDYPSALPLAMIVVALVLSIFLVALDTTIVSTAIPKITDEFQSLDQVGWYGSAFFLTLGAFQSTWGKAYKYFLLKPTFMVRPPQTGIGLTGVNIL